jgi:hypothetical protein
MSNMQQGEPLENSHLDENDEGQAEATHSRKRMLSDETFTPQKKAKTSVADSPPQSPFVRALLSKSTSVKPVLEKRKQQEVVTLLDNASITSRPCNVPELISALEGSERAKKACPEESTGLRKNAFDQMMAQGNLTDKPSATFKNRLPMPTCEPNVESDDKCAKVIHAIIVWINYALVYRHFNKRMSGLYLWSREKTLGKTMLCNAISSVFTCYEWVFGDKGWQQDWDVGVRYECIIYNAINHSQLSHRQIEMHGDGKPIAVMRRNQKICSHTPERTPFIITSNMPPEQLDYDSDMGIWTSRMVVLNIDECPLFDLIEKILSHYKVKLRKESPLPDNLSYFRIDE